MKRLIPLLLLSCASGPSLDEDRLFLKETTARAAKAADENDFDLGVRLYEESLVAARRHPELAAQARSIERSIEVVREMKADVEQAHRDWADLVRRYRDGGYAASLGSLAEMLSRILAVQCAHELLGLPWTKAASEEGPEKSIEAMRSAVAARYQEALALSDAQGLLAKKREIELAYLLEGREDFGAAMEAWQHYLESAKEKDERDMVLLQIDFVNRRAGEAWKQLLRRCNGLGDAEMRSELEKNAPRFRGTDAGKEIRARILELGK